MIAGAPKETTMAISELSRNVAQAVRRAEEGEMITVTRDGLPVAMLRPYERSNREALIALYADRQPDPAFATAIEEAHAAMWGEPPR
ncbi:type II toxin-antitoxin system prevent-host-death family antitoxin [Fodinicola feengrottensis]